MYGYKGLFNLYYIYLKNTKRQNENKYVFVLSRSEKLEGNLQFVYEELTKQQPNAEIVLLSCQNKMNIKLFKELPVIADAKVLFLDDYYLPIYLIKPSKRLKVIQLWHAAGAFKKFGYSTVGTKFGSDKKYLRIVPIHSNYTHVYTSSKHVKQYYAEAFNMPIEKIYSFGLPRTDVFSDETKITSIQKTLYSAYPMLQDEVVNVLYAPTYRADGRHQESTFNIVESIQTISRKMSKNKRLIVKLHPFMKKVDTEKLQNLDNILLVSEPSINDWMFISDAFITDYSSAVFEFALLKKPFIHYVPDYKEYKENRGFYREIHEISDGAIIETEEALIAWLNGLTKQETFNTDRMISFNYDYINGVSERIVQHILE